MQRRFLAALVLVLTACASDTTDGSSDELNIAGNWQAHFVWSGNGNARANNPVMHFTQNGTSLSGMMDDDSNDHRPSEPFTGTLSGDKLSVTGIPPGCPGAHYSFTADVAATRMTVTGGTGTACDNNSNIISIGTVSGTIDKL